MEKFDILVWVIGIGFTFNFALMIVVWNSINKRIDFLDNRINSLDGKIDRNEAKFAARLDSKLDPILVEIRELDKRLYGIETVLHMKDCCVLKQDQNLKKAE